jgi:hypothetical protein
LIYDMHRVQISKQLSLEYSFILTSLESYLFLKTSKY